MIDDTTVILFGLGFFTGWIVNKLYYEGVVIPNREEKIK